ncbi:MAG: DNA methyltransferase [Candidatus Parvarchaeum sp.]
MQNQNFDREFWIPKFKDLGYPVKIQEIPESLLREQKILPPNINTIKAYRLFSNGLIDVVLIEVKESEFSRGRCVNIARSWKKNNLLSPVIILTNSKESYISIIPGIGFSGEAKILYLSGQIYHTDELVLNSMAYTEDKVKLLNKYNNEFFPYQKVRDNFFDGYREIFQKLLQELGSDLGTNTRSFSQKFLGRIMFIYFLQRKGWLKNDKKFIDSISNYKELSKIYYNGLNEGNIPGIPFLNGSFFDREEYLTEEKENKIEKKLNDTFLEARNFFNKYNFTVDETSPMEVEVSIDPALIGTVFENLLLEKERGEKGTFYTPKDVISFICRRAIVKYLGLEDKYSPGEKSLIDGIQIYLDDLKKTKRIDEIRNFKNKLLSVRVVDPAVGSGGFLVVMMQEIVSILMEVDAIAGWNTDSYDYKKELIRNLYGFDIEPEAVEIAKLRLWLSMIIDQKDPTPLPNIEFNIVDIPDSLQLPGSQIKLNPKIKEEKNIVKMLIERYLNEHNHKEKNKLKKDIEKHNNKLKIYGLNQNVIESYILNPVDIVVMNPPYVRQESINPEKKKYYITNYAKPHNLDQKSDLYVYFFVRALTLLKSNGYISVISSDKWLETSYGENLQKYIMGNLISIYGQRYRPFKADINTVISIYGKETATEDINFTYFDSYASYSIVRRISINKRELSPGKWFYLRAPKLFMEKIYPKLTKKLSDFAEIKRGFTTGANDFFYMKDVSAQYEADYLANSKKFEKWKVKARNEKELKDQGLIYIENEGGERFVIDRSDTRPLVRTTRELNSYEIKETNILCLYTRVPGEFTKKYIQWGENKEILIRGRKEPVSGYNKVPSVSGRKQWYSLNDLSPTNIILPMYIMDRFFIPRAETPVICDHTLYTISPKVNGIYNYMNSTLFYLTIELFLRRLGGGVGEIMVDDYERMPVPDLGKLNLQSIKFPLKREVKRYFDEVKMGDRRELDRKILEIIGFKDFPLDEFYKEFVELVEDRLVKAARPLKSRESKDDQDN